MLTRLRLPVAVFFLFLSLCYLGALAYAQLPQCRISGVLYDTQGHPKPSARLTVYKVIAPGNVVIRTTVTVACNSSGQLLDPVDGLVGFNLPRNSQAYIYADAPGTGLETNPGVGTAVTIPNTATTTLESLIAIASIPTTGLTLKDEGTSLATLIGTINVVGSGVSVVQASAGVATLTVAGGGGSGTVTSVAATVPSFLSVAGSPITTSGTLAFSLANQNANLVFAGPGTGAATAPTFRSLVTADLPTGTGTGLLVFGTDPAIAGGSHTALTSFGLRSTGTGAFDLTLANSENLTAGRTLTLAVNNAARSLTISGDATVSGTNTGDQTSVSGNAGTATALQTGRSIYGNSFNGTADLNQIIGSAFGGTGNGFTKFSGPATSEKTFTLPNATATILTDNAAVTVAQGGSGAATLTGLLQGNGTSAFTVVTNSTTVGQALRVTGANAYGWGAVDLADTDAITNDLPYANLTPAGAASKLLGRGDSGAGDWQEITLGTNLAMSGTTLNGPATVLGANPTATIGLSAVNGSAGTFLRSDGAPALSQAIAPTWTAVHTFSPAARSSGVAPYFKITTPADTGQTADAEFPGIVFGGDASHATVIRTGADGTTIAEQREYRFVPPTYAFAGATTLTRAVSLYAASPIVGTSATFTSGIGALFEASAAAHVPLVLRGAGSQSGDYFRATDSSNAVVVKITSGGQLQLPAGSATVPTLNTEGGTTQTGIGSPTSQQLAVILNALVKYRFTNNTGGFTLVSDKPILWASQTDLNTTITRDTGLHRNAAGIVEVNNGTIGSWGALKAGVNDAGTTTVTNAVTVGHQSTGTPAAGFGTALLFNLNSSTTADQNAAQIAAVWTVATHATRTADLTFWTVNNAAALAQVGCFTGAGNFGIGTTLPTNILSLGGNAARTIWMERHTTADTAGNGLTIQAGGATLLATNKAGGSLALKSGTGTGSAQPADITLSVPITGTGGTGDESFVNKLMIHNKSYTMPDNTGVDICSVDLAASNTGAVVHVSFTYVVTDGTNAGTHGGIYICSIVNNAGTVSGTVVEAGESVSGTGAGAGIDTAVINVVGTVATLNVKFNNTFGTNPNGALTVQVLNNSGAVFTWL